MIGERKLGAAESRDFQIRLLGAFLDTAKVRLGSDGEIDLQFSDWAKAWWTGAYEAAMIGPCKPSWISPAFIIKLLMAPRMVSFCRQLLDDLKAQAPKR